MAKAKNKFVAEENLIKLEKQELEKEEKELQNLMDEQIALSKKIDFKPPGLKGKVLKKIVDENGNDQFIEIDVQHEDIDDNASVYEEIIDEFGNKTMKKSKN